MRSSAWTFWHVLVMMALLGPDASAGSWARCGAPGLRMWFGSHVSPAPTRSAMPAEDRSDHALRRARMIAVTASSICEAVALGDRALGMISLG